MLADADIAFSGCGFMGIYYVGVSKCIDSLAPDLLQRRIGGASAGIRATYLDKCNHQSFAYRCPPGCDFDG